MERMEYHDLILRSIKNTYPKYQQEILMRKLESKNIISLVPDLFSESEVAIDVSEGTLIEKIEHSIQTNGDTIKQIEAMEYEYPYKYATLFNYTQQNVLSIIQALVKSGRVKDINDPYFLFDECSEFANIDITPTFKKIDEDTICLKFSKILSGYNSNGTYVSIKYPIIVMIYVTDNVLEIRLDNTKTFLRNNEEYFYINQIRHIISWLNTYMNIELEAINLSPIVEYIKTVIDDSSEVVVSAQAMNLKTGSKAILDAGVNDDFVLPLLGELKNLMKENDDLLNSNEETLEIKSKLENFIFETEESSNLPWILLTWKNETKSKAVKVKFSFNYQGQDFSLLYYYGSNAGMEKMNNVTRYIIQNQSELLAQELE